MHIWINHLVHLAIAPTNEKVLASQATNKKKNNLIWEDGVVGLTTNRRSAFGTSTHLCIIRDSGLHLMALYLLGDFAGLGAFSWCLSSTGVIFIVKIRGPAKCIEHCRQENNM